ncbi:MAG: bifunctional diguanylate cyclase/phosphodiesterase [Pseudomonadota bacterium]
MSINRIPPGELLGLIEGRLFVTHFQPILDAAGESVVGHEALVRAPPGSPFGSPLEIFEHAAAKGRTVELDLLLIELAIQRFRASRAPGKLFVNIMPATLFAGRRLVDALKAVLGAVNMAASDIVLEITEHGTTTEPAAVLAAIDPLRALGCRIAIDDLGAGTSGLKIWSELRPEFVKVDHYFVDRIDTDTVAAEMMRSLLDMAHVMGSRVIAEAVERPRQCELLRNMGVDYLQGYLLGRPQPEPLREFIPVMAAVARKAAAAPNCAEELAITRVAVGPNTRVEEVLGYFQENRDWDCIVVVENERPLGIVRRDKLLTLLSKPLYPEIYNRKPVSRVMEADPVVVDARARLDQVSRLVTDSAQSRVNEDFIIARHGNYLGVGRTIDLLRQITAHQLEAAKQCNPLTQLPGNREIGEELFRLLALRTPFVVCHGDLDYFKAFNDEYGYRAGDQVLLHVADLFRDVVCSGTDFVGHVGGDDFILMLRNVDWHARLKGLFESFDASIVNFYSDAHRASGGFTCPDRDGKERHFPLASLSIGAVLVDPERLKTQDEVLASLQRCKSVAKAQRGNALAYDRDGQVQMLAIGSESSRAPGATRPTRRANLRLATEPVTPTARLRALSGNESA